jgi:hypothetical protein
MAYTILKINVIRSLHYQPGCLLLQLDHENCEAGQILKRSFEIELVELGFFIALYHHQLARPATYFQ